MLQCDECCQCAACQCALEERISRVGAIRPPARRGRAPFHAECRFGPVGNDKVVFSVSGGAAKVHLTGSEILEDLGEDEFDDDEDEAGREKRERREKCDEVAKRNDDKE